jgi:hypothetical protein
MPIVIRELVIRARVDSDSRENGAQAPVENNAIETERVISLCVEKVIKILERKKER